MATRQELTEALRKAHTAGDTAAAQRIAAMIKKAPPPSVASELGRAAVNLPGSAGRLVADTVKGAVTAIAHPIQTAKAVGQSAVDALETGVGAMDRTRSQRIDMSGRMPAPNAPNSRTVAPTREMAKFDAAAATANERYGTPRRALKTFADDPAAGTLAVASVAVPALRATSVGRATEAAVGRGAARAAEAVKPVGEVLTAERRGNATAAEMNTRTQAALKAQQAQEARAAAEAQTKATRLRELAEKARTRGNEQFARRADEMAMAAVPEPSIGTPRTLSEIGDTVRTPALANEAGISTRMRELDDQLRSAMDEVTTARAAEGVGVSDMPLAQRLTQTARSIVNPDPVARPTVGNVPADSAGGKLYKMVLDRMSPEPILLDEAMARAVKASGGEVIERGGEFYRVIKPSMKDVDDLRRQIGAIANSGELDGYGAINKLEARKLYTQLGDIMDEYAEGTSKEVQANWRLGKKALEPYEKYRTGRALVGTETGTGELAVPSANIPGRIVAGGRDTVEQAAMVAGEAPVRDALRSYVQNEFAGKNAASLEKATAPGTKLGDIIAADGDLEAAVLAHIDAVRSAEKAGQNAASLEKRAGTNSGRASTFDDIATKLTGVSEKSAARTKEIQRELAELEIEDPKKVGTRYLQVLDAEHAAGRITDQQYREGINLAKTAETAFKLKATRDRWLSAASWLTGGGALGGILGATTGLGPAGLIAGAVVGGAGRHIRNKTRGQ